MCLGCLLFSMELLCCLLEWVINSVWVVYGDEVVMFVFVVLMVNGFVDDVVCLSILLLLGEYIELFSVYVV